VQVRDAFAPSTLFHTNTDSSSFVPSPSLCYFSYFIFRQRHFLVPPPPPDVLSYAQVMLPFLRLSAYAQVDEFLPPDVDITLDAHCHFRYAALASRRPEFDAFFCHNVCCRAPHRDAAPMRRYDMSCMMRGAECPRSSSMRFRAQDVKEALRKDACCLQADAPMFPAIFPPDASFFLPICLRRVPRATQQQRFDARFAPCALFYSFLFRAICPDIFFFTDDAVAYAFFLPFRYLP